MHPRHPSICSEHCQNKKPSLYAGSQPLDAAVHAIKTASNCKSWPHRVPIASSITDCATQHAQHGHTDQFETQTSCASSDHAADRTQKELEPPVQGSGQSPGEPEDASSHVPDSCAGNMSTATCQNITATDSAHQCSVRNDACNKPAQQTSASNQHVGNTACAEETSRSDSVPKAKPAPPLCMSNNQTQQQQSDTELGLQTGCQLQYVLFAIDGTWQEAKEIHKVHGCCC